MTTIKRAGLIFIACLCCLLPAAVTGLQMTVTPASLAEGDPDYVPHLILPKKG